MKSNDELVAKTLDGLATSLYNPFGKRENFNLNIKLLNGNKFFPKPIKLGKRTTAWRVEDIKKLIENPSDLAKSNINLNFAEHEKKN